jgi:putative transposase
LTDAAGLPVSLVIDRANRHDMKLARATVEAIVIPRPEPTPEQPQKSKGMIMTKSVSWRRLSVIRRIAEHALKKHRPLSGKRASKRGAGVRASTEGGNRFRRILTRWEKRAESYLAMLHLACGLITWRATGLLR